MGNEGLVTHLWVGNRARESRLAGKHSCFTIVRDARAILHASLADRVGEPCTSASTRFTYLHDCLSDEWVSESCPEIPRS
jgi:hypothetical protein